MHRSHLRMIGGFAAMLFALAIVPGISAVEPKSRGAKSLDEQLLEDLAPEPQKPSARRKAAKKAMRGSEAPADEGEEDSKSASKPSKKRSLDDELLEGLEGGLEGEDVSLSSNPANENPLVRLNQRMKEVERRIAEAHGDEKTQRLQHEISDDLRKLIAEMERQCSQCKKSSSSSSRPQQTSRSKPSENPGQQASDKPASDSSARVNPRETAQVDRARMQEMLKDVWGHLPPHLRQQMEQSANEEFLPKYELEIAEYFRSLVSGRREKK